MALPSFKEEYGEGKPIDLIATLYHDFIASSLDNLVPSGFSLDQKGNFRLAVNIGSQIIVERTTGNWEDSRRVMMTLGVKGKIFIADAQHDNKTLVILPRGFELSTLKIFKGEDEQFLE